MLRLFKPVVRYWNCLLLWDLVATALVSLGFLLGLLCMLSNQKGLESVYFLKLDDISDQSPSITFGLYHYCVQKEPSIQCFEDKSIMVVPFEYKVIRLLNSSYPHLFANENEIDTDINPGAKEGVPHDPKVYAAFVLCLMSAGACLLLCVYRLWGSRQLHGYRDIYYSRGFLGLSATTFALLILILCIILYRDAAYQLNLAFPNLSVTIGPCMTMIGCAFMLFSLASLLLLQGCTSMPENNDYSQV